MAAKKRSRRQFLNILLGSTTLAWIGAVLYPLLRYLKPLPQGGGGGPLTLSAEDVGKLAREKFVIVRVGSNRVIVFQDPSEKVRALDARCTHEGCTVKYLPKESFISCACHNGRFDLDGTVLAGPPPRPLAQYDVQESADGVVVATRTA